MDDNLPWNGPHCPACGREMDAEVVETARGLQMCQRCSTCGLVSLVPDPFKATERAARLHRSCRGQSKS